MAELNGQPVRAGSLVEQVVEAAGLTHDKIPVLKTHDEVLASRRRLLEERPRSTAVAPPRVPERFVGVRFASTCDRPDIENWRTVVQAVHGWIQRVVAGEPAMLALIGPAGTSKSHLAYAAARHLHEQHGIHTPCYAWYELVDELRSGRVDETEHGIREVPPALVRQRWHATKFCILDEVRPTSGTDFDALELTKFALQRYDHRRSVLLTCNWASLAELVGAPAADRFTQVKVVGPSFRGMP